MVIATVADIQNGPSALNAPPALALPPDVEWNTRAPMSTGREEIMVAAIGGKIYAAGSGASGDVSLPDIPAAVGLARVAVIGNTAYVYNGSNGALYAFDLTTKTWASPDPTLASVGQSRSLMVAHAGLNLYHWWNHRRSRRRRCARL